MGGVDFSRNYEPLLNLIEGGKNLGKKYLKKDGGGGSGYFKKL